MTMNRRGFLSMLAAFGAEPLVPKGTAFSFLGGIYRPAWVEIKVEWPLRLEFRGNQTLTLTAGAYNGGHVGFLINSKPAIIRVSKSCPDGQGAVICGLECPAEWKRGGQLLQDRQGNYLIQERLES